jgi:Mn-dependent DtxR family transcriptional regulator
MCVSAGSATTMVEKLAELGLVLHEPYQGIRLTEFGEKVAKQLTRAHRILERFLVDHTIEEIEKEISIEQFFRINRKMIVHIDSIVRIENHFNNRFLIETNPSFEEEIIVSRLRVAEFKEWLDQ